MADKVIKELQTRIALKYDSYTAWTTAPGKDLVLLAGEIGICNIEAANQESNIVPTVLFKVGDGTTTYEKLPWASAKAADVYGWAKASEVKRDGKNLVFVGGGANGADKVVAFDYVTLAEVEAITNPLDARITAIETSIGEGGNLAGQVADLTGRLETVEGEGAGSIKKAAADAVATAAADATSKANTAEANAKAYADTEVAKDRKRLTAIEGVNTTQGAAITANEAAIAQEVSDRESAISALDAAYKTADTAINNKIGTVENGKTVVGMISEAQTAAANDATEKVNALANGAVKANTDDIAENAAAIEELAGDLADEASRATGVEADFETRIAAMETFWDTTEDKDGVVNKLKEIQDYIASDESGAAAMAGNIQANANAITALQGIVENGGTLEVRVDAAEAGIEALEGRADALEGRADVLEATVAGYDGTNTIKKAIEAVSVRAEKGITDAATADGKAVTAQNTADAVKAAVEHTTTGLAAVKNIADTATADLAALTTRVGTAESDIDSLEAIVKTSDDANSKLRTAIKNLQTLTGDASKGNEKLRSDLTALTNKVDDPATGLAKTKEIADGAASLASTNAGKIAAIEADYLKAADGYIFNCGSATTVVHTK